jgi:phytoene desaturase
MAASRYPPRSKTDYDVVVIGAGCGGLSAGALLAGHGRRVLVLDQNDAIGGCASTFERGGYRFDVGASVLEVLEPLERTFAALGTRLDDELDLVPCDPTFSVVLRAGETIRYPASTRGIVEALAAVSAEDARNWRHYASYCSELYGLLLDTVYTEPTSTVADLVALVRKGPALLKYLPSFLTSYQALLGRYFSDRVLQSFAFQALTMGLSPERLPGIYAFLPYGELQGPYYPRGGMIELPKALQRVGERHGMAVRLQSPVRRVLVERRRAIGVLLQDGTAIRSDVVVANVNAKTLYGRMIGEEHLPWLARRGVRSYRYDNALPVVYLGVDYAPPLAARHTLIAPTLDEINTWWANRGREPIPRVPFGMVDWPTLSDPSLAPDGNHVLNVTLAGTYHGVVWDDHKHRFVADVIEYLSAGVLPGLDSHVRMTACATPVDFERRIGLGQGGLHGLTQDLGHSTVFRPSNKSKSIDHLYLAGSSTNPTLAGPRPKPAKAGGEPGQSGG